ncbi:MAG: hypothetical protein AABW89_05150 [Nanoarchaeota archaeon]
MAGLLSNIVTRIKQGAENIYSKVKKATATVVQKAGAVVSKVVSSGINLVSGTVGTVAGVVNRAVVLPVLTIAAKDAAYTVTTTKQYIENPNLDQPKAQTSSGVSPLLLIAVVGGAAAFFLL